MSGDAVLELDPEKRAALYAKLQDALEETGGYLFLYHGLNAWLTRSPVHGAWSPDGQWALLREVGKADASSDERS
jgi:peptide/nickel transport system substrate-binding protein